MAGFTDGTTYTIGVRAYNATAEEMNTNAVTVTAIATGPAQVDGLVGVATARQWEQCPLRLRIMDRMIPDTKERRTCQIY